MPLLTSIYILYNYFIIFLYSGVIMLSFVKKYLSLLRQDFWLFALLTLPGMIFYFTGLYQLDALTWTTCTIGALNKFAVEFLTISIIISLIHVMGFTKAGVFALVMFLYYVTISADIVLLVYFKERFGVKYLMTLGGAQYQFLLDIRLILYLVFLYIFPFFAVKNMWHKPGRHASAKRIALCAVLLALIAAITPLNFMKGADVFFAEHLMDTTAAGIIKELIADKPQYKKTAELEGAVKEEADKYNLFKPTAFTNQNTYDRIILLTTEAFSNKFIKSFNPAIPSEASDTFDTLVTGYPYASLKSVTLSTLYGLSVIFSGHPNAELSFNNDYPLSLVKILKEKGFKTVFLRGANEEYMNEHIILKSAGFEEIYGAKYFESKPEYAPYVAWWGLTDRRLFDYAVKYLKEHKNDKLFMNILTVDTHVPTGRNDYLGQEYPPLTAPEDGEDLQNLYERPNMPRAFGNYNYDLSLFLVALDEAELLDDRTLLIITADHPFFANLDTGGLFKNYRSVFDEVPMIFISQKPIKEAVSRDSFKSQQDIAPTILGLAGIPAPKGMFGRSIFENTPRTVFNIKDNYIAVKNDGGTRFVPLNSSKKEDKALVSLLYTALTEEEK